MANSWLMMVNDGQLMVSQWSKLVDHACTLKVNAWLIVVIVNWREQEPVEKSTVVVGNDMSG